MRERSKLPVLLTELTIMLLVFALCAAVCLSIFFSSKKTALESGELSRAAAWAQSAAEVWCATGGDELASAEILGATPFSGRYGFAMSGEDGMGLILTGSGGSAATVTVTNASGEEIFSMDIEAVRYG